MVIRCFYDALPIFVEAAYIEDADGAAVVHLLQVSASDTTTSVKAWTHAKPAPAVALRKLLQAFYRADASPRQVTTDSMVSASSQRKSAPVRTRAPESDADDEGDVGDPAEDMMAQRF